MSRVDHSISILKSAPPLDQLINCLASLNTLDNLNDLTPAVSQLYLTLTTVSIPQIYSSLPRQSLIDDLFHTLPGLNALLLSIRATSQIDPLARIYLSIITKSLTAETLSSIYAATHSSPSWNQCVSLLFGGKLLNDTTRLLANEETKTILSSPDLYTAHLFHMLRQSDLPAQAAAPLCARLSSISAKSLILTSFESADSFKYLTSLIEFQQEHIQQRLLDRFLAVLHDYAVDVSLIPAFASLLASMNLQRFVPAVIRHIFTDPLPCFTCRVYCASLPDDSISRLFAETTDLLSRRSTVTRTPMAVQECLLRLILLSAARSNALKLSEFVCSSTFTQLTSNYLSAQTPRVRAIGMTAAELLTKKANPASHINFEASNTINLLDREQLEDLLSIDDRKILSVEECINQVSAFTATKTVYSSKSSSIELQTDIPVESSLALSQNQNQNISLLHESDDEFPAFDLLHSNEDPEDSDDDPTISKSKSSVSPPIYLKTLIEYFESDESSEKIEIGLKYGASLIANKRTNGTEILAHSTRLAHAIAILGNRYELDNFEELKLDCMIELTVSDPEHVAPELVRILFTGDFSLQQRISILSALALASRRLAELPDVNMLHGSNVILKQLPSSVLSRFDSHSNQLKAVTSDLQNLALKETAQNIKDELIGGGEVKWISSKLNKRPDKAPRTTISSTRFSKIAGPVFFSPLTRAWFHSRTKVIISQSTTPLLIHYMRTLMLIIHASYPSSTDIADMTSELLTFVQSYLDAISIALNKGDEGDISELTEVSITAIMIIMEVNDGSQLAYNFGSELSWVLKWLENNTRNIPDDNVKGLCAGLAHKLDAFIETNKVVMVGRYLDY
ncbi:hypothetical protein CANCADRAFT_74266 [Tortispora caseinolytica NRRL Y-17796]|uniref:Telomere length regulation protein conserved domain-containing protein n=1 Tax=Tortispora caseinolytica NRRL Y-17796 TaxID=767744 RepID=A0A1E4TIU4_9ASCO|nr:hypothetical protein CANCADRAFT_74266 [Tortispora caseinolytica NRRL Y-17796]